MSKIQLEPGPASSTTHHLTQPSSTLNRRYVTRPTNLAIEEVAKSIPAQDEPSPSTPSRLVNLRVHSADLLAANKAADQAPEVREPIIHTVVEMGGASEQLHQPSSFTSEEPIISDAQLDTSLNAPANLVYADDRSYTPANPSASKPANASSAVIAIDSTPTQATIAEIAPTQPSSSPDNACQNQFTPAVVATQPPIPQADPRDLAMSIAADYAAASMSAAVSEPAPVPTVDTYVGLDTTFTDSIDAIARAASDAIASIRTATEPEEISEQIASLQAFAENIRANSSMPEMTELSNTIDKFISVAMKSTKIKETASKKVALSSKASRAANKVTKSSAKVISRAKPAATTAKVSPTPKITVKKPVAARTRPATRSSIKTARPATRPAVHAASRPSATSPDQDQALRRALRSVAAMDDEPETRPAKTPVRRKGNVKRFALAFVCAVLCVGAVTYFVSANIPDISVRVAAMQTGVEASYPSYIPRDYSLKDISSESGKITITFEGPDNASFTLTEEKSSWDSTTLLRNYVEPTWKDNYTSTHEQGITIYVSGSNAAWVNGGVLYKINSVSASLTNKQLRNIVTSM